MNRSLRIFDTSAILNLFNRYYFSQHVCVFALYHRFCSVSLLIIHVSRPVLISSARTLYENLAVTHCHDWIDSSSAGDGRSGRRRGILVRRKEGKLRENNIVKHGKGMTTELSIIYVYFSKD